MNVAPEIDAPTRYLYLLKEKEAPYDADERRPKPGETAGGVRHVRIPVNVFDCPYLTHGAVRLYGRLQQHMGDEGCFPSYETLAGRMGCSERAVREYRMELEAAGVITHKRGGGARSNRYELTPERLRDMSAESTHKPKAAKSADIGAKSAKSAVESRQNLPPMSAKSAEESYLSNQTSLIKSTPTELTTTAAGGPAVKKVAATEQPTPTVEARPTEQERVPRAKRASDAPKPAAEVPATPREPTPIQRVEQGIKAAGVKVAMQWGKDGKALAELLAGSDVTTDDVTGCYVAIARGEYGSEYERRNLGVAFVCTKAMAGWLNWKEQGERGTNRQGAGQGGAGGAPRARAGDHRQPANPQHAAHAAKLDW